MKKRDVILIAKQVAKNLLVVVLPLFILWHFTEFAISLMNPLIWVSFCLDFVALGCIYLLFSTFVIEKIRYFRIPIMCLYSKEILDRPATDLQTGENMRLRYILAVSTRFRIKVIAEYKTKIVNYNNIFAKDSSGTVYEQYDCSWEKMRSRITEIEKKKS